MARSYTSQDLIELPRLRGPQAMALLQGLVVAARLHGEGVEGLHAATARLASARDALRTALVAAGVNPDARYSADVVSADAALDACWASLYGILNGWARGASVKELGEKGAAARRVLDEVFTSGLRFTQVTYPEEWSESEVHLERIAQGEHEATLDALGASEVFAAVRRAHATYGALLGLSSGKGGKAKSARAADRPDVRSALDEALKAMRSYVVKVAAQSDEHPEATAKLLEPLTNWESPLNKGRGAEGEDGGGGGGGEKENEKDPREKPAT